MQENLLHSTRDISCFCCLLELENPACICDELQSAHTERAHDAPLNDITSDILLFDAVCGYTPREAGESVQDSHRNVGEQTSLSADLPQIRPFAQDRNVSMPNFHCEYEPGR